MAEETREAQEAMAREAAMAERLPDFAAGFAARVVEIIEQISRASGGDVWTREIQNALRTPRERLDSLRIEFQSSPEGHPTVRVYLHDESPLTDYAACQPMGQRENRAVSHADGPPTYDEEAASELIASVLAQVDEIIERMGRDREEFERLKEETRSNISELQRMVAA
jgi:hypothetical protein